TAVINANLSGGDIAIIQSQMNTLPYFIIGNANIKSAEGLKGRAAAVHIPGTSADFAMRLALMKVNISYKDIKAITVGGAPAGRRDKRSGRFHRGNGRGKASGRKNGTQGHHRYGQAERSLSIQLQRHHPEKNSRESRGSAPGCLVHGGVDSLLQNPQRGIY